MGVVTQLADQIEPLTTKAKMSPKQIRTLQILAYSACYQLRRFQAEEDARNSTPERTAS